MDPASLAFMSVLYSSAAIFSIAAGTSFFWKDACVEDEHPAEARAKKTRNHLYARNAEFPEDSFDLVIIEFFFGDQLG